MTATRRTPAKAKSRHLALYDGRQWLGSIFVRDDTFEARVDGRRSLGIYASQAEACAAIAAAYWRLEPRR